MSLNVVILAAGKGTRMRSNLPKVLHPVAKKPMVQHVIDTAKQLTAEHIQLVYGFGGEALKQQLSEPELNWVLQAEQKGTGHAVDQARDSINDDDVVLVLYGDVPLIQAQTLHALLQSRPENGLALLTVVLPNPTGYGRIVRQSEQVVGIVEQKDATPEQLRIQEVNSGIMAAQGSDLKQWLSQLENNNAQGEFYLTDIVAMAHAAGKPIEAYQCPDPMEVEGANNRMQLAALERAYQMRQATQLMEAGATLMDPARIDIRGNVNVGHDVCIDVNCMFEGDVTLEDGVQVGPNCVLSDCTVAAGSEIKSHSIIEQAHVGKRCTVGPFARLRPGAELLEDAHVGNFVEMKKARLGKGSKANHLTYLGDAQIGSGVNIGAGTITCNYDGANKFNTIIEDDVFIGSDSQLVAPVVIAKGATVGAGSTVTHNVAENELVITRVKQRHIKNWQRPVKAKS